MKPDDNEADVENDVEDDVKDDTVRVNNTQDEELNIDEEVFGDLEESNDIDKGDD